MSMLSGGAPTLLSPGGAANANQSQLNPQSNQKGNRKLRAPGTFGAMREQGMARPAPQQVAQQQMQNAEQASSGVQPVPQAPVARPTYGQDFNREMGLGTPQDQATGKNFYSGAWDAAYQTALGKMGGAGAMAGMGGGAPAAGGGGVRSLLEQKIMAALGDPGAELEAAADSRFERESRRLGEQFDETSDRMNENFAARGLDASTIAASGLGKLRGQQAMALGDMGAQIEEGLTSAKAQAMQQAIANALGLSGQDLQRDLGERGLDLQREGLDLQGELGRGNLDLGRERINMDRENNADSRAFRDKSFEYGVSRDTRDFDYRSGRDSIADTRYADDRDYSRGRDTRNDEYRDRRDTISDNRYTDERDYGRGRDTMLDNRYIEGRDYDRGRDAIGDQRYTDDRDYSRGRDRLGDERYTSETTYNRGRDAANDTRRTNEFNTTNTLSLLQSMGINNMSPEMVRSISSALGLPANAIASPASSQIRDIENQLRNPNLPRALADGYRAQLAELRRQAGGTR